MTTIKIQLIIDDEVYGTLYVVSIRLDMSARSVIYFSDLNSVL